MEFIVNESLEGRAADLKEYTIALAVFGRTTSFDPTADNIVRVEARRLRTKLDEYYAGVGWLDPVRIHIPKGGYAPQFISNKKQVENYKGSIVGPCRIEDLVAETPDGMLFRAIDVNSDMEVSLWLSSEIGNPIARRSVVSSAHQAAALSRFHILPVREVGEFSDRVFIISAPIAGRLLSSSIQGESLPFDRSLTIAQSLSRTLEEIHSAGLVIGSLRPHNVVMELREGSIQAVLMLTAANPWTSPEDMGRSPEQRAGKCPDQRSDIWALGEILNQMMNQMMRGSPKLVPEEIPIAPVVERCRRIDPELRYQTAAQLSAALEQPKREVQVKSWRAQPWSWILVVLLMGFILFSSWFTRNGRIQGLNATVANPIRLVVLPFANLTGDAQLEPMADGLAELLAGHLGSLPGIQVVSSHMLGQLKNSQVGISEIGRKFSAPYVLGGTFAKSGDRVQVTAKLTRTSDLKSLWTASYGGLWNRVLDMDRNIAVDAAKAIGFNRRASEALSRDVRTGTLEAFEVWSKGHAAALDYVHNKESKSLEEPLRLLSKSLELYPGNVEAMVDMGYLHWISSFPPPLDQSAHFERAEQAFRSALAIAPEHPRALSFLGILLFFENHRRSGLALMERAVSINAGDGDTHFQLANAYAGMGFWEAALVEADRAIQASPLINQSFRTKASLLSQLGRHSEAMSAIEELPFNSSIRKYMLGYLMFRAGRDEEAKKVLIDGRGAGNGSAFGHFDLLLAAIEGKMGNFLPAKRALAETPQRIRVEDQLLLLDAIAGNSQRLIADLPRHPLDNNYRWVVAEPTLKRFRNDASFRNTLQDLYGQWRKDLAEIGPRLPAQPPQLPTPDEFLRDQPPGI